jgi:hypothetical protein
MTLGPGESEGGRDNRHQGADRWLYVVSSRASGGAPRGPLGSRRGNAVRKKLVPPTARPGSTRWRAQRRYER